jgi:hypothetical protein
MSPDLEERLSDALKRLTPEPPYTYTPQARTILPADASRARIGRWWPAAASVAAVLVLAGGILWQQASRTGSGTVTSGVATTASAARPCFGESLLSQSDSAASGARIDATVTLTNTGQLPCRVEPVPTLAVRLNGRSAVPLVQDGPRAVTLAPASRLVYSVRIRRSGTCTTDDVEWRVLLTIGSRVDAASWLLPTHACRLLPGTSTVQVKP